MKTLFAFLLLTTTAYGFPPVDPIPNPDGTPYHASAQNTIITPPGKPTNDSALEKQLFDQQTKLIERSAKEGEPDGWNRRGNAQGEYGDWFASPTEAWKRFYRQFHGRDWKPSDSQPRPHTSRVAWEPPSVVRHKTRFIGTEFTPTRAELLAKIAHLERELAELKRLAGEAGTMKRERD